MRVWSCVGFGTAHVVQGLVIASVVQAWCHSCGVGFDVVHVVWLGMTHVVEGLVWLISRML